MSNIISHFYGMTILMPGTVDNSKPHFEVLYEGKLSKFCLDSCRKLEGELDADGQELIRDWFDKNRYWIRDNWNKIARGEKPIKIDPLL